MKISQVVGYASRLVRGVMDWLVRRARQLRKIKTLPSVGRNQEQECVRRCRHYERHGTAIGGGRVFKEGSQEP